MVNRMKIKYEIEDYDPKHEYMLIKFTQPDNADWVYYKSVNPPSFTKEKLIELLHAVGTTVTGFWERAEQHLVEPPIPLEGVIDVEPEQYSDQMPVIESLPQPDFDVWTERLEAQDITDPFQGTVGWDIIPLTEDEQREMFEHMEMCYRMERNEALKDSDFFNLPDACVANVQDWLDYRHALRNLPEQQGWPKNIIWPERPEVVKETIE